MQSNLVSLLQHLAVKPSEIGAPISEPSRNSKKCHPYIFLIQDSHDLLRVLWLTIINAESE
jgi:hypothetical protein